MDRIVLRGEWNANPAWGDLEPFDGVLVDGLALHHTVTTAPESHSQCDNAVRSIQQVHFDKRTSSGAHVYDDIAYNWLLCPHGYLFRGRGSAKMGGANGTRSANARYVSCALIGKSPKVGAAEAEAIQWLRRRIKQVYGSDASGLKPHSAFVATACPGDPVRTWIRNND